MKWPTFWELVSETTAGEWLIVAVLVAGMLALLSML